MLTLRRAAVRDEYVEDGRSVVMVDDRVLVLSELATALLGLLGDASISVDRAAAALVERFGPAPTDAVDFVRDQAEALRDLGLVVLTEED